MNLSAGYFGELIKKETGKTAQEYVQAKVTDVAKEKIFDQSKSVSEISYELGLNTRSILAAYLNNGLGNRRMNTGVRSIK